MRLFAAVALLLALTACGTAASDEPDRATPAQAGQWRALAPATLARTEVAAARIGRHVYVVGGFERDSRSTTPAVERYDIRRNRWRRVASMPVGLNHPAAAAYRGRLYVLGGYTGRGDLQGEVGSLYRYDPRTDRWSRLRSMPTPRAALAVGVIGNRLYAAGGADNRTGALPTLEIYDFRARRWSRGPRMATAREHVGGAVAGGRLYVVGGRAAGRGNFATVERYDPRRRRWQRLPDLLKERGGNAAAGLADGRVVALGGEEGAGTIAPVEVYERGRWRSLPPMRTPRHGLGAIALGRRVYAIQGGPEPGLFFSDAIEALEVR